MVDLKIDITSKLNNLAGATEVMKNIDKLVEKVAIASKDHIRFAALRGYSGDGKKFKPYSKEYKKKKSQGFSVYYPTSKKRGGSKRTFSGRAVSKVNLTLSGDMLQGMYVRKSGAKSDITFRPAQMDKAKGNNYHRKFMVVSDRRQKIIVDKVYKLFRMKYTK